MGDGSSTHQDCDPTEEYYSDCNKTPVQVAGLSGVTAISSSATEVGTGYALKSDGTVWAWGSNYYGQLGDGIDTHQNCGGRDCSPTPVQVAGLSGVTAINASFQAAYAQKPDGTVWAWGSNEYGQLGDGSVTHNCPVSEFSGPVNDCSSAPVQVSISGVSVIFGGTYFAYALKSDGTLWGWGSNSFGVLGDQADSSASVPNPTPVQVTGLGYVTAVSASQYTGYALVNDVR